MKTVLKNNKELFRILNKLILDKYYEGNISPNQFELLRDNFPNNIRVLGKLNEEGDFDITYDYKFPTNYSFRIFLAIISIAIVFFIFQKNWFVVLILLFLELGLLLSFRLKGRKEKELFLDHFIDFKKRAYEKDF
ncbi:hypothetical protein [Tenacibaculum agarivorans]|uniref:hypothetical protein n=1 Tax=Tenacibaculum agarivorans TaxID=1908389 RepID=UPI00094BB304|nr:hypothetical protein [Tenacibaculum agarivorans]